MLLSSRQPPAALHWNPSANCQSAALAITAVQRRQRPLTSCCQQACTAAAGNAEALPAALSSSKGTSAEAEAASNSSGAAVCSSGGGAQTLTTTPSTRNARPNASMATGVPALESLVDPDCVAEFFCGIAAGGSICIIAPNMADGLRYYDSGVCVGFGSSNKTKLDILQKFLQPAQGRLRAFSCGDACVKNNTFELYYLGGQCKQALQGYAAKLALEYLETTRKHERRAEICRMLASFNMHTGHSQERQLRHVRNDSIAQELISAAFIAGYFAAHGSTYLAWHGTRGYTLLKVEIDSITTPRMLFFIQKFLGYGVLMPASERPHGEHGAYDRLYFTSRDDINRFCALVNGDATSVSDDVLLPATASGLPRAIGQTLKLKTLSTYFQRCGRLVNGKGHALKTALVDGHMRTEEWLDLCKEFGGMHCPDWER